MTMTVAPPDERAARLRVLALTFGFSSLGLFVLGWFVFFLVKKPFGVLAWVAAAQATTAIVGIVYTVKLRRQRKRTGVEPAGGVGAIIGWSVLTLLGLLGIPLFLLVHLIEISPGGFGFGAWGRPLRLRGKVVHPRIRAGEEWAAGDAPDVSALDPATRRALAAWWLQDAKKEHASVPAFARVAWQLAALGAPAALLERAHRAALEEIDHARRCFALVAAYGGKPVGVEPMPELLAEGFSAWERAGGGLVAMAVDSLVDGCFIEDLNSDAAELALSRATDPAVRGLLARIVRDERDHARLAWDIVAWCLREGGAPVAEALDRAAAALPAEGGGLFDDALAALVAAADLGALHAHGRVPLEDWPPLYRARLALTRDRLAGLLAPLARAA